MKKVLFVIFAACVLGGYALTVWMGWEMANAGSKSRLGVPFIYTGFRGGK